MEHPSTPQPRWKHIPYQKIRCGPIIDRRPIKSRTHTHTTMTISFQVIITEDDRVELFYMLRGRGGSNLKTKLLDALDTLDPTYAAQLRKEASIPFDKPTGPR